MSKNLKDKRIEIFEHVNTKKYNHEQEWKSRGKYWAYTRVLSMREFNEYGLDTHEVERIFVINYHKEISPNDHILYRGNEYSIYHLDTLDDNRQDIKIYAENVKPRRIGR